MNLSMQPKTYSPNKYNSLIRSQDFPIPTTVKKTHPLTNQSPYTHSPQPQYKMNYSIVSEDQEIYKFRCSELERELAKYKSDYEMQRLVHLKSTDLESKVTEVLEHNNSLQSQLERAQKAVSQRKSEGDMWKQKYEVQMGQLMQIKQNYESEIQALSQEIQQVNAKISSCELDKNRSISDQRTIADTQNHQISETFSRSNSMQAEMYEVQLKKLRDILEDKTLQVAQLQAALERQKAEATDSNLRLMNEIEQYKSRMSSIQIDHQQEMHSLKNKLDLYQETNLKNAQISHDNQTDILLQEIDKLKNILEIKNQEIETLINQNQKQKLQFDQECDSLRQDIDHMKRQLLCNEQTHQEENHNIQQNLECLRNNETTSIKISHENQIQALQNEIIKLKEIIDNKNGEIEKQMIEKGQQKDYYDGEINRLITTIEDWKRKLILVENEKNREISDQHVRIERLTLQYESMQSDLQKQIAVLQKELGNLQMLLDHKNQEINQNQKIFSQIRLELEEKVRNLQNELEMQKLRSFELEKSKLQEINELRQLVKDMEITFKEKIKQLEQVLEHQKYEINKTMDLFNNKQKECDNLSIQRNNAENIQRKLQEENDRLVDKLQLFEQEKNLEIDELRKKMDSGAAYQFENLKSAYNTQVGILSEQIVDLQNQLGQKNKELTEMIEKYTILDRTVLPESVVARNTYNSRVGIAAEFIANKSIHDVTVRSQLRNSSIQRY